MTEKGRADADAVAKRTAGQFTEIYSSPLGRARETADTVAKANPQAGPVNAAEALRPWALGAHEGELVTPERIADLADHVRIDPSQPLEGVGKQSGAPGESFNSFKDPLIAHVQEQMGAFQPGDRILNVTHYRDIQAVKAWGKEGFPRDRSIDPDEMTVKGDQKPGELFRLDPKTGKITEVLNASKDGIYFLRHGETGANEGAAAGRAPATPLQELTAKLPGKALSPGTWRVDPDSTRDQGFPE